MSSRILRRDHVTLLTGELREMDYEVFDDDPPAPVSARTAPESSFLFVQPSIDASPMSAGILSCTACPTRAGT